MFRSKNRCPKFFANFIGQSGMGFKISKTFIHLTILLSHLRYSFSFVVLRPLWDHVLSFYGEFTPFIILSCTEPLLLFSTLLREPTCPFYFLPSTFHLVVQLPYVFSCATAFLTMLLCDHSSIPLLMFCLTRAHLIRSSLSYVCWNIYTKKHFSSLFLNLINCLYIVNTLHLMRIINVFFILCILL